MKFSGQKPIELPELKPLVFSGLKPLEKARMKKGMTSEGRVVLQALMTQYQMSQDAAMRLMRDGGQLLAVAILTKGSAAKSIDPSADLRTENTRLKRKNTIAMGQVQQLQKRLRQYQE